MTSKDAKTHATESWGLSCIKSPEFVPLHAVSWLNSSVTLLVSKAPLNRTVKNGCFWVDPPFRFRVQKANFAFLFSGGLKKKADPLINFPLLTKSVTWDTVCAAYLLDKGQVANGLNNLTLCTIRLCHLVAIFSGHGGAYAPGRRIEYGATWFNIWLIISVFNISRSHSNVLKIRCGHCNIWRRHICTSQFPQPTCSGSRIGGATWASGMQALAEIYADGTDRLTMWEDKI